MKRVLPSICGCLCTLSLLAQPALTSADIVTSYQTQYEYQNIDNPGIIDTNVQGAGVTWDFDIAGYDPANPDQIMTAMFPVETPYKFTFPDANFVWKEEPGEFYSFYERTADKMERVGSASPSGINTFTDPQTEYVFPLALGTTNVDTWNNTNSTFGGGIYALECVGYGTLKLPTGTFDDILMVRVRFTEGAILDYNAYYWYDANTGVPLLYYIAGDGFFVPLVARYTGAIALGVEGELEVSEVRYNNPVEEYFNLRFTAAESATLEYTLHDLTGKQLLSGSIDPHGGAGQHLELDLGPLDQGMYLITIYDTETPGHKRTLKVVKE